MKRKIFVLIFSIACTAFYGQEYGKMSSWIRNIVMEASQKQEKNNVRGTRTKDRSITAIVRCDDTAVLQRHGCRILASWADKHIISTTVSMLSPLSAEKSVKRIEAGKSCKVTNDLSASATHTDLARKDIVMPDGRRLTGEGVVVGVMDIGLDLTHPTFWSSDMTRYRIKALWDQLDYSNRGKDVVGEDTIYLGRQYTTQDELLQKECSTDATLCTHGTHTTGTAAGSGSEGEGASPFSGMAPEAEICLVANFTSDNMELISEDSILLYNTATDLLGFKYITDYAESVEKPCVINFSEGSRDSFYDTQLYIEILNEMVGKGRIICSSAGNESLKATYLYKPFGTEKAGAFLTNDSRNVLYTMLSDLPPAFSLTFYDSNGEAVVKTYDTSPLSTFTDSVYYDTLKTKETEYVIGMTMYRSCYDETKWATELLVSDTLKNISLSNIALRLYDAENSIRVYSISGGFGKRAYDPSLNDFYYGHNILFPGCAENIICVGATSYCEEIKNIFGGTMKSGFGTDGVYASYSSMGPTLSGLTKPDVVAPGTFVVSSYASQYYAANAEAYSIRYAVREFSFSGRKYVWAASTGTSMSCPVVTGIIALWLQVCPTLSPSDIKDILAHSAMQKDTSLTYPNNKYGYGEIDALAGIRYIQERYTGIKDVFREETEERYYDLSGRAVSSTCRPGIYLSSSGRKILIK